MIRPTPTDDEAAAIAPRVDGAVAAPGAGGGRPAASGVRRWRFSGRWWSAPTPVRRDRPVPLTRLGMDVTTVADDLVVFHDGERTSSASTVSRPTPTTSSTGIAVRTLPRPPGELLCRFGTVNDVHFGEIEAGRIDDRPNGPILRVDAGRGRRTRR